MEFRVNDYVRFKDKRGNTYIRKVIDGYKEHWYGCRVDKTANNVPYVSSNNIIKSSPNIIDLIEVGDYVNGLKVAKVENNVIYMFGLLMKLGQEDIKSIVTKEQFLQMEYKVNE